MRAKEKLKLRVKKILENKNIKYQQKYFILSKIAETKIYQNEDLYEVFQCYMKSLNSSNGSFPNKSALVKLYENQLKSEYIYKPAIDVCKSKLIKEINMFYNDRINDSDDVINSLLESVDLNSNEINIKLEKTLYQAAKKRAIILSESEYKEGNIVDLTKLFDTFDEPKPSDISAIQDEEFEEDILDVETPQEKQETSINKIDKTVDKITKIFEPIVGNDPRKMSKKDLAAQLGYKGNGKYVIGQSKPVLKGWDQLELKIGKMMSPYGRSKGMSTVAQRKFWLIQCIKFCLLIESQAGYFLGISSEEKSKLSLSQDQRDAALSVIGDRRRTGQRLSPSGIKSIMNKLQNLLLLGDFNLESSQITEGALFKLLKEAAGSRIHKVDHFRKDLDIMYPLHDTRSEFEKVPLMSPEERAELERENISFDKQYADDSDFKQDVIDTKEVIDNAPKNEQERLTIHEVDEISRNLKTDMARLKELTSRFQNVSSESIFKPFEVDGEGNIIPDAHLMPEFIPTKALTDQEIKEIKRILERLAQAKNISIVNYDRRGDVYKELIDKAVTVDEFISFRKKFKLDKIEKPMSWEDISRASYGVFKGSAGSRQYGVKSWLKGLFYSSNANEKSDIYATLADRWVERLIKLDLIDDKAFSTLSSKKKPGEEKAIPASVLSQLEKQGKYSRSKKLQDISSSLELVTKYATNPKYIKRYFDSSREDNYEQIIAEKLNQISTLASSEDEYDYLLSRLEKEDPDVAAYAVLDAMFSGNSGFRIFATSMLKEYYNKVIWPDTEKNLAQAVKKYFDVKYGQGIIAASMTPDQDASDVKESEGKDLFNKIIYLVMQRTGIKSSGSRVPEVGSSQEEQRNYLRGITDSRGDLAKAVYKFNQTYRQKGQRLEGIKGGVFGPNDVELILDDMFNKGGIIHSAYSQSKDLDANIKNNIITWILDYKEGKLDDAIILSMALSDFNRRTGTDDLIVSIIDKIGKDTKKALTDYKKNYKGLLVGKDFSEYLDYEFGFDTADLKSKGSAKPGGKSFQ